jgi:thymidylate synthase (FAD)
VSRRYVDDEPEFYTPDVWRGRSADKKQGSEGVVNDVKIGDITLTAKVLYNSLIDRGVCT